MEALSSVIGAVAGAFALSLPFAGMSFLIGWFLGSRPRNMLKGSTIWWLFAGEWVVLMVYTLAGGDIGPAWLSLAAIAVPALCVALTNAEARKRHAPSTTLSNGPPANKDT